MTLPISDSDALKLSPPPHQDETSSVRPPRKFQGLTKRLVVSAITITLLVLLFVADHATGQLAPVLLLVGLSVGFICVRELMLLLRARNFEPNESLTQCTVAAMILSSWMVPLSAVVAPYVSLEGASSFALQFSHPLMRLGISMLTFFACILLIFFSGIHRYKLPGRMIETLGAEFLCLIYVGLFLCCIAHLRWVVSHEAGYLILASLIIATKGGDIGGYVFGRFLGRARLSPRLSPAKTWWGVRGAILVSTILTVLWLRIAPGWFDSNWQPCSWIFCLSYSLVIGILGVVGDLSESLIKRDLMTKDSARLLPGFGGFLDILDSVLYASPAALAFWILWPPLHWT